MFGVSETSLQTILLTARCQVDVIHDRHDPLFGGRMPSPTEGTVSALRQAVLALLCLPPLLLSVSSPNTQTQDMTQPKVLNVGGNSKAIALPPIF